MTAEATGSERFDALYDAHFESIRAYCARRLPAEEANDAVAEVFVTVWVRLDDVPAGDGALPYIYGIARNKVAHARRSFSRRARLRRRAQAIGGHPVAGPESLVVARAEEDLVTRALESLRPADQEVIRLRAWEELSAAELAVALDVAEPTARKRLSRALGRLGAEMKRLDSRTVPARRKEVSDG